MYEGQYIILYYVAAKNNHEEEVKEKNLEAAHLQKDELRHMEKILLYNAIPIKGKFSVLRRVSNFVIFSTIFVYIEMLFWDLAT